ncbi:histidine--tRNA ligase, cytoplasmic-like [Quercus lobata]|uniref:Histidine--tRNA ligase, cytoplasmic n=1 Tax=Quercus lobata TaxID=97700 RepID=A0A7N2MFC6_QUELO|nr:histidine--tRNA ligase, cytoplasmic-like [Quercus lobata]XP_030943614.1 histidine--tRNA ligase, cytoplasmic-like [Quercus lobata]
MASDKPSELSVITLGGKGSSLSSSSLYAIAIGLASLRLDSSALDRLSSPSSNHASPPVQSQFPIPKTLAPLELRAFLTVLLYKLLRSDHSTLLPIRISEALNKFKNSQLDETLELDSIELSKEEASLVEKLYPSGLFGVSAVLDHESAALSAVSDAVAALSCEAIKADVAAVFNSMDSGDGFSAKEEAGVASDMKVLLNGSKLVGKVEIDSVSKIAKVHGSLREIVKLVHSKTRIELNSKDLGSGSDVRTMLYPLAAAINELGECSLSRVKANLDSISNEGLRSSLVGLFEGKCASGESLRNGFKLVLELGFEKEYEKFVHQVNVLLGMVWKIVAWEAMTGFIALEGVEWSEKSGSSVEVNGGVGGGNLKGDKKGEKKKKVLLGKGTSVIVQLIKDRLQGKAGDGIEKWVDDLLLFLDPKDREFDSLLKKLKELVETNESRRLPKLPKGTRDFAKEQMTIRKRAFSIIEDVFERHGATALDTPAFELRETLMGKYGEDSKLVYDLADQGGELCSLRYDLTVPFARYVAMNGLTSFKRYQIAKVYRRDNPSKGRYREFYQCDLDIAGQYEKMGPDFEIVKILTELLDELQIGDYEIKLNHRKLLDGMLDICGVPPQKFRTICSSIDKLDKQPFEQIRKEMVEEKGLSVQTADEIGTFVKERGHPLELLSKLKQQDSKFLGHNGSVDALNDLEILFKALEVSKCIDKVVFDLSLARGLDYYTGVIFEAVFKGGAQVGSIAAGGRYDNLIGMFGAKQVPAVGVSLGIERVFAIMEQLQKDQSQAPRATKTEVLVSIVGDDLIQAAELVSELWNAKVKAEYFVNKRVMKHIDRARESRIPWMVIVGEREMNEGIVVLKDVEAAKDDKIPRSRLVEELKSRLNP